MSEPGIEITRVFDAPRERIWQEWTEPERFADWFGGPEAEIPLTTVTMDVRPGGGWSLTMIFGPREIHWHGEYHEVVPPERLVFTITDQPEQERPDEHVIVDLVDLGNGRTRDAVPAARRRPGPRRLRARQERLGHVLRGDRRALGHTVGEKRKIEVWSTSATIGC